MSDHLPWYHTSDQVDEAYAQLARSCLGAELKLSNRTSADGNVTLSVAEIGRPGTNGTTALVFFGVHGREFFSVESGLDFAKTLCGQGKNAAWADRVLNSVRFVIVPNANPHGRRQAEAGDFCKRTNAGDVDLNRNWGFAGHMPSGFGKAENYPGRSNFSEPESQLLQSVVADVKPDFFLDIHSGSYLLGTPWCYAPDQVPQNQSIMNDLLKPISEKYCDGNCPYGNAANLVGYPATGCDMDYVKAVDGVPFVFTFEVYVGESFRDHYRTLAAERRANTSLIPTSLSQISTLSQVQKHGSQKQGNLRSSNSPDDDVENINCLKQFNPMEKDETNHLLQNWSAAYLDIVEQVDSLRLPSGGYRGLTD